MPVNARPRLASPRIKLLCARQTERGAADECGDVYQNTIFTIRADEPLMPGTSLRFVRTGNERGDIELAQLGRGQSARVKLPSRVCTGVTRGTLEIQVMRRPADSATAQVVDTLGPYYLRCS